jgi:hypothetical protein
VLEVFYPHANLEPLVNGLGRNQQFVNLSTVRNRGDIRLDHQLGSGSSVFARASWQAVDPGTVFEDPRFPNLGVQDRRIRARTVTGGWTRAISGTLLNEIRAGYSTDRSNRRSSHVAADVVTAVGLELPATAGDRRGYPSFTFQGSNRIRSIADNSTNATATRVRLPSASPTH